MRKSREESRDAASPSSNCLKEFSQRVPEWHLRERLLGRYQPYEYWTKRASACRYRKWAPTSFMQEHDAYSVENLHFCGDGGKPCICHNWASSDPGTVFTH